MAIYRPPKARWPLATATAIAGLLVGLVGGLVIGRDEYDPTEAAQGIKATLTSAAGSLEVAAIEYAESVEDGAITKRAEFDGAMAAVASSRAQFSDVRPALELLWPASVEPIDELYEEVERAMNARDDSGAVGSVLERLQKVLEGEVTV